MNRVAVRTRTAVPSRIVLTTAWLLLALALACTARADQGASGAAGDSVHRSAAQVQEPAQHFSTRMQATAHKVIAATSRGLHQAFDATARGTHRAARAVERAAERARNAFHNI